MSNFETNLPGNPLNTTDPIRSNDVLRSIHLQQTTYESVWKDMQEFTLNRDKDSTDELWFVEHQPVFTIGLNGSVEHLLDPGDIPVVHVDRGGQVTYHGPGQLVVYTLIDLARRHMGVVEFVRILEQSVLDLLTGFGITGEIISGAPGVYVDGRKIAAIGLRVKRGRCYHGLAINVDMDLAPFTRINPCGYSGLEVTQLADLEVSAGSWEVAQALETQLARLLGYTVANSPR